VCLSVSGLWGGLLTAPQPFNHVSTSFGTITLRRASGNLGYNKVFWVVIRIFINGSFASISLRKEGA
jgi:hypothetical protein